MESKTHSSVRAKHHSPHSTSIVVLVVFLLAALAASGLIWRLNESAVQDFRARAIVIADIHNSALSADIEKSLSAVYALASFVSLGGGSIRNFNVIASDMLLAYDGVSSLQLAPGGVIQNIVPLEGNEKAIGLDLLKGKTQAKAALIARDTGKLTLDGPFNLVQGGIGLVGRLPVFLLDDMADQSFWGFTSVLIRFPTAIWTINRDSLERQGYAYKLWRLDPGTQKILTLAESSSAPLISPINQSFRLADSTWTLSIAPQKGWSNSLGLAQQVALGLLFSLMLALLAKQMIGLRIHKQELETKVEQRTTEVKMSEARYRVVSESANDAIITVDSAGSIANWNRGAENIFGYTEAEVTGQPVTMLMSPQYHDQHRAGFNRLLSGGEPRVLGKTVELVGLHKDRHEFPVELSLAQWAIGGDKFFTGIIRDISERKRAEEMLIESEDRNRDLVESSDTLICIHNLEGCLISVNAAAARLTGFSKDALLRMNMADLLTSGGRNGFAAYLASIRADGKAKGLMKIRTADGKTRWWEYNNTLRVEGVPEPLVRGMARDITDRKAAEDALAESEGRFRATFEQAAVGIAHVALNGRWLMVNQKLCDIVGYTQDELLALSFQDITHPDDLETDRKQIGRLLMGEIPFYSLQKRYIHKNGEIIWANLTSTLVHKASGASDYIITVIEDSTLHKRIERELVDSESRFRVLVEQSIAGIYIIQDNKFVYVNPRFAEIRGFNSADELVGCIPESLVAEKDRSTVAENNRRLIAGETQSIAYSFIGLRKDGSTLDVGLHSSVATYRGRPAIIGLMQDISEKKRAEEKIQHYVSQLETAFMSTVQVATSMGEMRDPYTGGHQRRVAEIAVAIGAELGFDARRQEGLRVAGYLHDIGKITIPAEILSKPGKLSSIEYQLIKGHSQSGYDVLKDVSFPWPVAEVAHQHHERMDGSGYPQGLKGEAILFEARIMAVADVLEAMSSHRPYRAGLGLDRALSEIERGRGSAYDPDVVDVCLKLFREKGIAIPA